MNTKNNLCDFILFGGHGDLAFRKLMPALYHLCKDEYISQESRIITVSRKEISIDEHKSLIKEKLNEFLEEEKIDKEFFEIFKKQLSIVTIDFSDESSYEKLQTV